DSGSSVRKDVLVRLQSRAPLIEVNRTRFTAFLDYRWRSAVAGLSACS
ncbi:MAG: hypothetical protein ACI8W3_002047, partial [Myxococcota bacterium]